MDRFLRQSASNNDARLALYPALFLHPTADSGNQGSGVPDETETTGTMEPIETLLQPGERAEATQGSANVSTSRPFHTEQTSF